MIKITTGNTQIEITQFEFDFFKPLEPVRATMGKTQPKNRKAKKKRSPRKRPFRKQAYKTTTKRKATKAPKAILNGNCRK